MGRFRQKSMCTTITQGMTIEDSRPSRVHSYRLGNVGCTCRVFPIKIQIEWKHQVFTDQASRAMSVHLSIVLANTRDIERKAIYRLFGHNFILHFLYRIKLRGSIVPGYWTT